MRIPTPAHLWAALTAVLISASSEAARRLRDDRGQTTAEYALVLVGAAAVAVLLLTWATTSGRIGWLLSKMIDTVANMVE